ncbi:TPA: tail fiber assembly protein [Klebsiella pneumoniae]
MAVEVYVVIDSEGNVVSTSLWDGEAEWAPPEGMEAVKTGDSGAGIGWTYKKGKFTPPPPPPPEVPKEDLISQAEQQKANLIAEASQTISILQDAVDLNNCSE